MPADLGLIGAGAWGKNLARNFHKLGVLRSICDTNAATLAACGAGCPGARLTESATDLFHDPEIKRIAIAAPAAQHFALAKAALDWGKDVFVEKPLCLDLDEARELESLAASGKRILMVGHLLQYHASIRRLQSLVKEGRLGELQYLSSHRLNLGKVRKEENALWSFAPHDLSVILSLLGSMPDDVACSGQAYLTKGVADTTMTQLRFPNKVRAPWNRKLALYSKTSEKEPEYVEVPESEPLADECAHFLDCCRTRKAPRTDAAEAIRVLSVLRAAQSCLDREEAAMISADYFAHPTAVIDPGARVGKGSKIWHFSHLMAGCELGESCNLGQNVVVSPDVKLGRNVKVQNNVSLFTGVTCEDDVFLGPGVVFTNVLRPRSRFPQRGNYQPTVVRRGATIGANATVLCGLELGESCFIGAGAVVTKNVPAFALMVGNPAKQTGWVCRHGDKLDLPLTGDGTAHCTKSATPYVLKNGVCRRRTT
ncbi:MAG: Gfo/Idh/MocA family oxidoreductase [Planctomycetes bacterium]|nr:Gfo/Idh/MocA family oxidoreductase [Planctomycetota bacterium]